MQLLTSEQSRTDVYPIASDLVFILPKLILSHPPGKEKARARVQRIQQCLQQASQEEWKALLLRVLDMETPRYEQDASQPLATGADSLTPRDSLAKPGDNSELHPQYLLARPNGKKQSQSSPHMPHQKELCLSERTLHQKNGTPLPGSMSMPYPNSRRNKAADAGGWTTETAQSCMNHPHLKQVVLAWIHTHATATSGPARRRGLWRTHRLVCLHKGEGGHQTHSYWHDLVQTLE